MAKPILWFAVLYVVMMLSDFIISISLHEVLPLMKYFGFVAGRPNPVKFRTIQRFQGAVSTCGDLFMGLLFDHVGAHACVRIAFVSTLVIFLIRMMAVNISLVVLMVLPHFFARNFLILRLTGMQEIPPEFFPTYFGRTSIAEAMSDVLQQGFGAGFGGEYATATNLGLVVSLASLASTFYLTSPHTNGGTAPGAAVAPEVIGKNYNPVPQTASATPLPVPTMMLPSWMINNAGFFKVISRPVVFMLFWIRFCNEFVWDLKYDIFSRAVNEKSVGFINELESYICLDFPWVMCIIIIINVAVVGPCMKSFTPKTFLLACLCVRTLTELTVKISPISFHLYLAFAAKVALDNVVLVLLVMSVAPSERGTCLGLEACVWPFWNIFRDKLHIFAMTLYDQGGSTSTYTSFSLISLALLFMVHKSKLPYCGLKDV